MAEALARWGGKCFAQLTGANERSVTNKGSYYCIIKPP